MYVYRDIHSMCMYVVHICICIYLYRYSMYTYTETFCMRSAGDSSATAALERVVNDARNALTQVHMYVCMYVYIYMYVCACFGKSGQRR